MSPNVSNFVHDLVEMAKAMETLPQVQAENERLQTALDKALDAVSNRESNIIGYKQEIDDLHAKVRSLEVERDDASFRVLEVEERTEKLERSFQSALEAMDATDRLIQSFKPIPMPEPVKEPEPVAITEDQRIPDPQLQPITTPAQDGQSVSNPTVPIGQVEQDVHSIPATSGDAGTTTKETSSAEPTHGPYFGKRYIEVEGYISRYDWEQGGGTNADYDWRPN